MRHSAEERAKIAGRLRSYADLDYAEASPWWWLQRALYEPDDVEPSTDFPAHDIGQLFRDLADLIDAGRPGRPGYDVPACQDRKGGMR